MYFICINIRISIGYNVIETILQGEKMYDFNEFYKIGNELSLKDDEAHIRSAINRDYYALFGESRKYLVEVRGKKYLTTKNGVHTKVCNGLRFSKDPSEKYVGDILFHLKKVRGHADYDWTEKNIDYFKKSLVQTRNDVQNGLESLEYLNRKYANN